MVELAQTQSLIGLASDMKDTRHLWGKITSSNSNLTVFKHVFDGVGGKNPQRTSSSNPNLLNQINKNRSTH